jgi:hypothetical protein
MYGARAELAVAEELAFDSLHQECALSPATIFRMNTSEKRARNYV